MLPYFLPTDPPKGGITDCARVLSSDTVRDLEGGFSSLSYNPKVVILPNDFSPSDLRGFSMEVAKQWSINGDRLLLVVDIKGHKVRALSGDGLLNQGITGDFLSRQAVDGAFVPYMKRKDLPGAIRALTQKVNSKLQVEVRPVQPSVAVVQPAAPVGPSVHYDLNAGFATGISIAGIVILALIGTVIFRSFKKEKNKELRQAYNHKREVLLDLMDMLESKDPAELIEAGKDDLEKFNTEANKFIDQDVILQGTHGLMAEGEMLLSLNTRVDLLNILGASVLNRFSQKGGFVTRGTAAPPMAKPSPVRPSNTATMKATPPKPVTKTVYRQTYTPPSSVTIVNIQEPTRDEPEKHKEETSWGDSGSTSWDSDSSSSSSSSSSWGDSGSSSWDSGSSSSSDFSGGDGGGSW